MKPCYVDWVNGPKWVFCIVRCDTSILVLHMSSTMWGAVSPFVLLYHRMSPSIVPFSPVMLTSVRCSPCNRDVRRAGPLCFPSPYDGKGNSGQSSLSILPKITASFSTNTVQCDVRLTGHEETATAWEEHHALPAPFTAAIAFLIASVSFVTPSPTAPKSMTLKTLRPCL